MSTPDWPSYCMCVWLTHMNRTPWGRRRKISRSEREWRSAISRSVGRSDEVIGSRPITKRVGYKNSCFRPEGNWIESDTCNDS